METLGYALLPALSLDTAIVAMGLARSAPAVRTLALLTAAEALAPLLGYGAGMLALRLAPLAAGAGTAILLVLLGVHLLREAREGNGEAEALLSRGPVLGAAAAALDELGLGAALPALHVSPLPTVLWLAVQAPLAAALGLWLGRAFHAARGLRYVPGALVLALGAVQSVLAALVFLR